MMNDPKFKEMFSNAAAADKKNDDSTVDAEVV